MNTIRCIRLAWQLASGAEGHRDFPTAEAALAAVDETLVDWVIFEVVEPGRYATAGRVLASAAEGSS